MGERKHKAEDGEKEAKSSQGIKASPKVTNPILQLQRLIGNKAVADMIQRHMSAEADSQHIGGQTKFHEAVFQQGVPAKDKVVAGVGEWRAANNAMVAAYNEMVLAANKAKTEPCEAESE